MAATERMRTEPFTWAGLIDEPDDGLRREIIGGNLIVNPAPVTRHHRAVLRLATALGTAAPADLEVFGLAHRLALRRHRGGGARSHGGGERQLRPR
ncbi:hypothetical protein BH23ACT2_BH23ACT2_14230 [soil metagenome]